MKPHFKPVERSLFRLLVVLSLFVSACGGPASTPPTPRPPEREVSQPSVSETTEILAPETADPITNIEVLNRVLNQFQEPLEPIVPETTEVLTPATTDLILEIQDDGTFVFEASAPGLEEIAPEDVIVGDPTEMAPDGFLRKVTNISSDGDIFIVETEQATLEDAIQQGSIRFSKILTTADVRATSPGHGVRLLRLVPSPDGDRISLVIDAILDENEAGDQIKATGRIDLEPVFDLNVDISGFRVEYINFDVEVKEQVTLGLSATMEIVRVNPKVEVARLLFFPIRALIAEVPVWVTPELVVYVGLDGRVSTGISTSVSQEATFTAGLIYFPGELNPIWIFPPPEFSFTPPSPYLNSSAKLYTGPQFVLKLYGGVGPFAELEAYLKVQTNPLESPVLLLHAGIAVNIGVKVEILSRTLVEVRVGKDLLHYKKVLLEIESLPTSLPQTITATSMEVTSQEPIFGPSAGSLIHEIDGFVEYKSADVDLRDFVTEAIFYTPYPTSKSGWDFGFLFRDVGKNDQFRLVIESDGDWYLNDRRGDELNYIHKDQIANLDRSEGGSNRLMLVALGDQGVFFVNDHFIAALDLSSRTDPGDIRAATEILSTNEIDDEVTEYEDFTVWSLLPVFGPLSGSLTHEIDDLVEGSIAGVNLRDFVTEAIFYNPYPTSEGGWDFGFLFRHIGFNAQLRLVIESDGRWSLQDWRGDSSSVDYIDEGYLANLDVSEGGSNRLKLIALGDQGIFFVNDSFIEPLDLSSRTDTGDIHAATDLIIRNEVDDKVTEYEDFTVWSLPSE